MADTLMTARCRTADLGPLLRYRRQIGADDIAILADIKKNHAGHGA